MKKQIRVPMTREEAASLKAGRVCLPDGNHLYCPRCGAQTDAGGSRGRRGASR